MSSPTAPGVCVIWTTAAAVTGNYTDVSDMLRSDEITASQIDLACQQASDLLFVLSGRQFTGACERTFRPVARPVAWTVGEWARYFESLSGYGWSTTWGACAGGGHDSCRNMPQIDLHVPIREVTQVKIDGTVIPSDEYRVDNGRLLVRTRPAANAVTTARWGWPTCQIMTLPDTEPGTFSVDVIYGSDPPVSGVTAAMALAVELAKAHGDAPNRLPQRLTSISRQGVSMAVVDPMQFLDKGLTGVYEADVFIKAYNPHQQRRRPRVYSPDLGYSRSQGS